MSTKVSLNITDVAIVTAAATKWLKLYRAKQALKNEPVSSNELEAAIERSLISLKETIGCE